MYPEPPLSGVPLSERMVREALRSLPDSWVVLHSVAWQSPDGPSSDGEADFVLLHPTAGLGILEVKGGAEVSIDRGQWYSLDHRGDRHRIKNPFQQAQGSKHTLLRFLKRQLRLRRYIPCWHGVVFPGMERVPDLGPNAPEGLMLTGLDLRSDALEARLWAVREQAGERRPADEPLTSVEVEQAVDALVPTRDARSIRGERMQSAKSEMLRLTNMQVQVLQVLKHQRRALILGPAGTGKTVLAVEKVRELSAAGFRPHLLVHGEALRNHLNPMMPRGVVAHTAISFLSALLQRYGLSRSAAMVVLSGTRSDLLSMEGVDLQQVLEQARRQAPLIDALVADETQYYPAIWWDIVDGSVGPDTPIYCFGDEGQNPFSRQGNANPGHDGLSRLPFGESSFELDQICRNTREISDLAAVVRGQPLTAPLRSGLAPRLVHADYDAAPQVAVVEIERLLEQGAEPRQILLVADDERHRSECAVELARRGIVFATEPTDGAQGALWMAETIDTVGLEADIVVVVRPRPGFQGSGMLGNEPRSGHLPDLYIAATRARFLLVLVGEAADLGWLDEALPTHISTDSRAAADNG